MPDFFPLSKGAMREYASSNAQGSGTFKIEVLSVSRAGGKTTAKCRRTTRWNGGPAKVAEFEGVKDSKEVRSDAGTEFKRTGSRVSSGSLARGATGLRSSTLWSRRRRGSLRGACAWRI